MNRPTLTHIIWDWNGTLLNDLHLCHQLTMEQMRRCGVAPLSVQEYRELFAHPVSLFYHRLGFHLTPEEFPVLSREFHVEYTKRRNGLSLQEGAVTSLHTFRSLGIVQVILSAHEQSILDGSLDLFGIREYFQQAWGIRNTLGHSKLDMGRALLEELAVPPQQVLLVGDTDHDAEVADKLGLHCALIEHGFQARSILSRTGKPVFSSLNEIHPWIENHFTVCLPENHVAVG